MMVLDRKIALLLMGIFLFFYIYTFQYPPETVAFPRFLLWVFLGFSVLLFIFPRQHSDYDIKTIYSREKLLTAGLLIVYAILFPILGFFVTSFLFLVSYMMIFNKKGWKTYLIIATTYMVIVYVVFQKMLFVWFPQGLII